jgi:hypothetical protein
VRGALERWVDDRDDEALRAGVVCVEYLERHRVDGGAGQAVLRNDADGEVAPGPQ